MTLADFTSPSLIISHLRGQDAASVIQELSQALQREKRVPDLLPFYHAALNHEFLVSSDMEAGMAFPHARLPGLKELAFALAASALIPTTASRGKEYPLRAVGVFDRRAGNGFDAVSAADFELGASGQRQPACGKTTHAHDAFQMLEVLQRIKLQTGQSNDILKKLRTNGAK